MWYNFIMIEQIISAFLKYTKTFFLIVFTVVCSSSYFFIASGNQPFYNAQFTKNIIHLLEEKKFIDELFPNPQDLTNNQMLLLEIIKSQNIDYMPVNNYVSQCMEYDYCSLSGELLLIKQARFIENHSTFKNFVYDKKLLKSYNSVIFLMRENSLNPLDKMFYANFVQKNNYSPSPLVKYICHRMGKE